MVPINFGKHLTASEDTLGSVNFTYVALFQKGVDRVYGGESGQAIWPRYSHIHHKNYEHIALF